MKILVTVLSFILPFTAFAQSEWTALRVNGQPIASAQVRDFTEASFLSETQKEILFSLAGNDYNRYLEEKQLWLERNFERGLRQMGFVKQVEAAALAKKDRGFRLLDGAALLKLQEREIEALTPLMKRENIGVQEARIRFAENLAFANYPHRPDQTPESLYWDWYKSEENRITENLRMETANTWLAKRTLGPQRRISSFALPSFVAKIKKDISAVFAPLRTPEEVERALTTRPEFSMLIKHVEANEADQAELAAAFAKDFIPALKRNFAGKILAIEGEAYRTAKETPNALLLRESARKAFDQGKFEKARIDFLAAALAESKMDRPALVAAFKAALESSLAEIRGVEVVELAEEALVDASGDNLLNPYYAGLTELALSELRKETSDFIHTHRPEPTIEFYGKKDRGLLQRAKLAIAAKENLEAAASLDVSKVRLPASVDVQISPAPGQRIDRKSVWEYCTHPLE